MHPMSNQGEGRERGVPVGTVLLQPDNETLVLELKRSRLSELFSEGQLALGPRYGTAAVRDGSSTDKVLLKPDEAAVLLGVGRTKVYELLATGAIRSVQIGSCRRISRRAVDDFVRRLEEE